MKVWKVILATIVIFCAGVFAGLQGGKICRHRANNRAEENPPVKTQSIPALTNGPSRGTNHDRLTLPFGRPPFKNIGKDFVERLDRDLKLEPEQRKKIDKIIDESQKHAHELWKKFEPEMREEMKKTRQEIREVLSTEQSAKFDELMKRKQPKEGQGTNNPAPPAPPAPAAEVPPPAPQQTNQ